MQFTIMRLMLEITSARAILREFNQHHSLADVVGWIQDADELRWIGLIVCFVIIASGVHELVRTLAKAVRARRRRN